MKPDEVEGWGPTRVVRCADAHAEVAALKERSGQEILMFGSHVLWNDLLANGLVDELHFMIGAGVVGEGVRAFERRPPGSLPPAGHPHLQWLESAPSPVRRRALTETPRPDAEPLSGLPESRAQIFSVQSSAERQASDVWGDR